MIRNYLKTALRSFRKNITYTLINIFGLAVGLSGVIVIYLLYDYEYQYDRFHKNTETMYRVNTKRLIEGNSQKWGSVPSALGPLAYDRISGIEYI